MCVRDIRKEREREIYEKRERESKIVNEQYVKNQRWVFQ